jgi:hypothetical protein
MMANVWIGRLRCGLLAAACLSLVGGAWAAEGRARPAKLGDYNPQDQTVEMCDAIQKGDIAVRLVPKDSPQSRVLIENKTDKPLNVKLPESFGAVPVLAQNVNANRTTNRTGGTNNTGSQMMGGGMGGMGMGGMGMGGGMGMFNVPPEKVGQLKVPTVCLEHGKGEPRAAIPYEIKPLETVTTQPGVRELCELLGRGQIVQRAAQAAAWHLNNGMSWQELSAKRLRYANGTSQPYFTPQEIQTAMGIASQATRIAEERQQAKPTSTSASANTSASDAVGQK